MGGSEVLEFGGSLERLAGWQPERCQEIISGVSSRGAPPAHLRRQTARCQRTPLSFAQRPPPPAGAPDWPRCPRCRRAGVGQGGATEGEGALAGAASAGAGEVAGAVQARQGGLQQALCTASHTGRQSGTAAQPLARPAKTCCAHLDSCTFRRLRSPYPVAPASGSTPIEPSPPASWQCHEARNGSSARLADLERTWTPPG